MEWDQIADKWTAMTHRLRRDGIEAPRNIGGPQDALRATKGIDAQSSDKMPRQVVGNDRSPPPNQ